MDALFKKFIKKHHVLTLATTVGTDIWCANCFYTYDSENNCLIFTSDDTTKHAQQAKVNPEVAGSIVLETRIVGKIQGIQFKGKMIQPTGDEYNKAKIHYLKRFPVAALMQTNIWIIHLTYLKLTDNQLGFGKKLIWDSKEESDINISK